MVHDGLICADIALRIASDAFTPEEGLWYVLEPQFQATSERLFGFTDVGSAREREEAAALQDAKLAQAVSAVEGALAQLSAEPTERDVEATCSALQPLHP